MESIETYTNYRELLKDLFDNQKREKKYFSCRNFARKAGLGSPSYLNMVIKGDRNLTNKSIQKVTRAFAFNKFETTYFEKLVYLNQSNELEIQNSYLKEIKKLQERKRNKTEAKKLTIDQYQILSEWYYYAIRELVLLKNFREDPKWISKKLNSEITPGQAKKSLELLVELGFLKRQNEELIQCEPGISTDPQILSVLAKNFHKEMLLKSIRALNQKREERHFEALTIAVSDEDIPFIKKKLFEFRESINDHVSSKQVKKDKVYQMTLNLFNVTKEVRND